MAQKKITDLQLISALADAVNFPVDNGIQTYRATLAQVRTLLLPVYVPPAAQRFLSGSGTYYRTRAFLCTSAACTVGATYTHNSVTWTVVKTVSASNLVYLWGNGTPLSSGTLTKASGTGDATIAFTEYRDSLYIVPTLVGGGGGGGGAGSGGSNGGNGGNTTFGSNLTAGLGTGGAKGGGGPGGGGTNTATATAGQTVIQDVIGGKGMFGGYAVAGGGSTCAPMGGTNPMGGTGPESPNSGAGGKGGSNNTLASSTSAYAGDGGGAGGYLKVRLDGAALSNSFAYAVGAAGTGGSGSGTGQNNGEVGAAGQVLIEEFWQ